MTTPEKISNWSIPDWHPDYDDVKNELSILRSICTDIARRNKLFNFELESAEDGYIYVQINEREVKFGEIYVTNVEENELTLFTDDGEYHFHSAKEYGEIFKIW